jgi:hypothetical protein
MDESTTFTSDSGIGGGRAEDIHVCQRVALAQSEGDNASSGATRSPDLAAQETGREAVPERTRR